MTEIKQPSTPVHQASSKETADQLRSIAFYSSHLRKKIPQDFFENYPLRFAWCLVYACIAIFSLLTIKYNPEFPILLKLLISIATGLAFGGLGFFAHELYHGSIIKNRTAQDFFGFFCMMPFFITPTFWRFWHNQLHHGKTQALLTDPDAFPTLKIFRHSKFMQYVFPYTPGSGHKRSSLYLFFWFSFHVFAAQTYLRFRNAHFDKVNHNRITLEFSLQLILWTTLLYFLGWENLVWTFLVPLFAQNYFAMSYISTNHNLSPLTKINDPLVNSLTVTNIPIFEWFHMHFGYHVEHHIFPTMSGIYTKRVHQILKADFPNEYQYMSKWRAIKLLYSTPRIYKNMKTLVHPETGETFETLKGAHRESSPSVLVTESFATLAVPETTESI